MIPPFRHFSILAFALFFLSLSASGQSIENRMWVCVAKTVNEKFQQSDKCNYFTLKLDPSNKTFDQRGEKLVHGTYELSNDKKLLTLKTTYNQVYRVVSHDDMILLIDQSNINPTKSKFYLFPK